MALSTHKVAASRQRDAQAERLTARGAVRVRRATPTSSPFTERSRRRQTNHSCTRKSPIPAAATATRCQRPLAIMRYRNTSVPAAAKIAKFIQRLRESELKQPSTARLFSRNASGARLKKSNITPTSPATSVPVGPSAIIAPAMYGTISIAHAPCSLGTMIRLLLP